METCLFCKQDTLLMHRDPDGKAEGWYCAGCGGVGLGEQVERIVVTCPDCLREHDIDPRATTRLCIPCWRKDYDKTKAPRT